MAKAGQLFEWCGRWNWIDAWLHEAAAATAALARSPNFEAEKLLPFERGAAPSSGFFQFGPGASYPVARLASPPAWDPMIESGEAYAVRIAGYLKQSRDELIKRGWRDAPAKEEPRHFDWLARFQVAGLSLDKVVADAEKPPDRATVSRAIKSTAMIVDVTLRKAGLQ